ncbi:hypothetical protein NDU88_011147 [Pleurodeles waltl]|uniref:Uncharacterized protein n=1 Tax=Pleurodeles waltl TaxID=8319 RepID=A0AAV7R2A0_PLEWA|nr:hypothetical protein NDU88_011147 [Pleurodeles waltl]
MHLRTIYTLRKSAERQDDGDGTFPPEEPSQHTSQTVPLQKQPLSKIPVDMIIQPTPKVLYSTTHRKAVRLRCVTIVYLKMQGREGMFLLRKLLV